MKLLLDPEESSPDAEARRLRTTLAILGVVIAVCLAGLVVSYLRLRQVRGVRDAVARAVEEGDNVFFSNARPDASLLGDLREALVSHDDRLRADACLALARFFYGAQFFSNEVWDFSDLVEPLGGCAQSADLELRRRATLAAALLYVPSVRYGQYWKTKHDLTRLLVDMVSDEDEEVRLRALAGLRLYEPFEAEIWQTCSLKDVIPQLRGIESTLDVPKLAQHLKDPATAAPLQIYLMDLVRARKDPGTLPVMVRIFEARAATPRSLIEVRVAATALEILLLSGAEAIVPLVYLARLAESPVVRAAAVDGLARLVETGAPSVLALRDLLIDTFRRFLESTAPYARLRARKGLVALGVPFDSPQVARPVVDDLAETLLALNHYGNEIERVRFAGWEPQTLQKFAGLRAGLGTVAVVSSPVDVYDRLLTEQVAVLSAIDPKGSAPAVVAAVRHALDDAKGVYLILTLDDKRTGPVPLLRYLSDHAGPELVPLLAEVTKVRNGPLLLWACCVFRDRTVPATNLEVLGHLINHLDYPELAPYVVLGLEAWVNHQDVNPDSLRERGPVPASGRAPWDRGLIQQRIDVWRLWWKDKQKTRVIHTPTEKDEKK